jgi:hypothetical protein
MDPIRRVNPTTRRRFLQSTAAGAGAGLVFGASPSPAIARVTADDPVFSDDFDSLSTIDVNATGAPGYQWYPHKWFSSRVTRPQNIRVSNSVLTLGGAGGETGFASLVTAFAIPTAPYFRGKVFGNGGFFSARIAFDHAQQGPGPQVAPAFWSMAIEHISDGFNPAGEQWPGQEPGYAHYIELDFMEHFRERRNSYVCTIHDWSGKYDPFWWYDISNGNNIVDVGPVNWSEFHTYSCYWVPQNGTTPGHAQWFFDGLAGPTTNVYWKGPPGSPPLPGQPARSPDPPARASFTPSTPVQADRTYSVIDRQRLALHIGTDPGWPMRIDWVKVWGGTPHTGG